MSDTHTANSSHALPTTHPFLEEIKTPAQKLLAKKKAELETEYRTARGIEAALNSLEDIPGVPGKLLFKVVVSDEGYQVHAKLDRRIITQ